MFFLSNVSMFLSDILKINKKIECNMIYPFYFQLWDKSLILIWVFFIDWLDELNKEKSDMVTSRIIVSLYKVILTKFPIK